MTDTTHASIRIRLIIPPSLSLHLDIFKGEKYPLNFTK